MELYVLDSLLRRTAVIDRFESLIWTERYSAWGDFEVQMQSTNEMRRLFAVGTRLAMNESYRVMTVEFVEDNVDSEGRQLLVVKGRSLEALLENRTARNTAASLEVVPKWHLTGTPANIMRTIFNEICRDNMLYPEDEIPFITSGTLFPPNTIEEPADVISIQLALTDVYTAIKELGDVYSLGFRIVRNFDESELYFDVYSGDNKTTSQGFVDPVVFSPELDNLTNITEITSISNHKNVAYVHHPIAVRVVFAQGTSETVEGFERRVLTVDASDIALPDRPDVTSDQSQAISAAMDMNPRPITFPEVAMKSLRDKKRLTQVLYDDIGWFLSHDASAPLSAEQKNLITEAKNTSWAWNVVENDYIEPLLQQRGKDELAKHRSISAFDGELPPSSPYKYDLVYRLGDLVEMNNIDGVANQMRVTEQIFVSDAEGERSYPTLAIDLFITPGSWQAWNYSQVWEEAEGTWQEQP